MSIELKSLSKEVIQHNLMEKENAYLVCHLNIQNAQSMIEISKEDIIPREELKALRELEKKEKDEDKRQEMKRKIDIAIAADNGVFSNEQNVRDNERAMKIHAKNIEELRALLK